MDKLFKEQSEWIRIYIGKETVEDKFEKNISVVLLNPYPVRAIVTDIIFSQIQWKMPGLTTEKAKEIIINKKKENLLKASQKIKIQGEYYYGWKVNGKLQYRIEGNYIRAYVYYKKV